MKDAARALELASVGTGRGEGEGGDEGWSAGASCTGTAATEGWKAVTKVCGDAVGGGSQEEEVEVPVMAAKPLTWGQPPMQVAMLAPVAALARVQGPAMMVTQVASGTPTAARLGPALAFLLVP